ncbi:MAG: tetraacyldisaccharide 4'-kinase [Henriciella sp.]|nr:tetraacyldisaccharide 4'-kinase [Henriciella sp.]
MREPRFWSRDVDPKSREAAPVMRALLTPFAWAYAEITRRKIASAAPVSVPAIVICVGNLTAGGTGKSPVVTELRARLESKLGLRVATLSRGYKGRLKGPLKVQHGRHTATEVGDEPLMLSATGESWIGADRAAAGQAMCEAGVELILMDDGHQNPGLAKDFTLIVVDAEAGFGNGFVIPKGPLRESVQDGLERADAIIVMGDGNEPAILHDHNLPIFRGQITAGQKPPADRYVAFAGIGRPEKFFDTLQQLGVDLRDSVPFPDHHVFTESDMRYLRRLARDHGAWLITTEKDYVRLSTEMRREIEYLPIQVQFDREADLDSLLEDMIKAKADG